jgi:hypothetical protein
MINSGGNRDICYKKIHSIGTVAAKGIEKAALRELLEFDAAFACFLLPSPIYSPPTQP